MGIDCRQRQNIKIKLMHRCSKHMLKFGNSFGRMSVVKHNKLCSYVDACKQYASDFLKEFLANGYEDFAVGFSSEMKLPKMIKYSYFNDKIKSELSGRTKNQIVKQIQPLIVNWIKEWNYWFKRSLKDPSIDTEKWKKFPEIKNFELTTTFCDIQINENKAFLELKALGKFGIKHGTSSVLRIPFKIDKRTINERLNRGWRLSSAVTVTKSYVILNWEKESQISNHDKKQFHEGQIGCDQGISSIITLAYKDKNDVIHSFQSPFKDKQGWTLSKIIKRMKRCRKGSKQYARYQKLRANFIRWSINQAKSFIRENNIKVVALEDIRFLGKGRNVGGFLSKFEHSLIRSKLTMMSEENGVFVTLSSNSYRSQRCSNCGFVHKLNRKKGTKQFKCLHCGFELDADLNAALNHSVNLESKKFGQIDNERGEFWKELGSQLGVNSVPNDPESIVSAS